MQLHVLAARCADAGRAVDRRGRRACLLKGLPREEIAPRRPPGWCGAAARWVRWATARSRMNCSPARPPRRVHRG